ncbi:MAG: tetratricopeptide repeat protein [Betaproteobacteria bacterium]
MRIDTAELLNRGNALRRAGRHAEALAVYEKVLNSDPENFDALNGNGISLGELGRYPESISSFARAIVQVPDSAEALNNHGLAHARLDRHQEALPSYERALCLKPEYVDALNNYSDSLFWLGRYAESLDGYNRALRIDADSIVALTNRGRLLVILCRYDEALAGYERALTQKPDLVEAWSGRASVLAKLGRYEESLQSSQHALKIRPDFVDAHLSEAHCRLRLGDFRTGLMEYEWRHKERTRRPPVEQCTGARWTGREDLRGKTILLRSEQGLGDTILFSRYARLVAERGAYVLLEVPAALAPLMSGMTGVRRIIVQGGVPPVVDFYCPLPSLPLAFNTEPASIPSDVPYLAAAPDQIEKWRRLVSKLRGKKIGLSWSGNARQLDDRARSVALKRFEPLLSVPGTQFVCVQKDVRDDDASMLAIAGIVDLSAQFDDFSDTAALISVLDLVISVDTSVAHLTGALGKPVWVLLPFMAYWPWLLEREDNPWYPTARLFRQPQVGEWDSVILRVGRAVADWNPPTAASE